MLGSNMMSDETIGKMKKVRIPINRPGQGCRDKKRLDEVATIY